MSIALGVKTDPIQHRYSYEWLFALLEELHIHHVQLGGFFEMPVLDDRFFLDLRGSAERHGVRIRSVFTAHRELGGFFSGNVYLERAARALYERFIHIGSLVGADFVGSGPGSILRDRLEQKEAAIACYLRHMKELMHQAKEKGIKGLSMEIMSCQAEPPASPHEVERFMAELGEYHRRNGSSTVPVYVLADVSHGLADRARRVVFGNLEMFEVAIPYLCEFHLKNTDRAFEDTFGFSEDERRRGIVRLADVRRILERNAARLPLPVVTGYLELPGPKIGRDYADCELERMLSESIRSLRAYFPEEG